MSAWILPLLLGLAVLAAWLRLGWRQWRAPVGVRSHGWRLALLLLAQPVLAALLYLTLAPPPTRMDDPDVLSVLTRGGTPGGGATVALPEAVWANGVEHAPDLATALRRHPGIRRLRIRGEGLEARDRDAAQGLALAFDPLPLPPGLVVLELPERTSPGGLFRVSGRVEGGGSVALRDPAGTQIAAAPVDGEGRFTLEGAARLPGVALFRLLTRNARGDTVSQVEIPVHVATEPGLRVTLLGGAPGPEVKFWQRWATDAGLRPTIRVALGAGLTLGDATVPLTTGELAKRDLLILDERSWAGLGAGERAAVVAAVRGGMGVLLRVTGPVPSGYGAAFGLPLSGGAATAPVRLLASDGTSLPPLTRRIVRSGAGETRPLLADATGAILASWRPLGRGRVAAWFVTDSAGLVSSGHGDRYGELWAQTVSTLARAGTASAPRFDSLAHRGERTALCGLEPGDRLTAPDGQAVRLLADRAMPGCAGYWPKIGGWHVLRRGEARWPFYVHPVLPPGLAAAERRDATLALVRDGPKAMAVHTGAPRAGASWPWLLGLIAFAALIWWFERATVGRSGTRP